MTDADRIAFDAAFQAVLRVHGRPDWSQDQRAQLRKDYFEALADLSIQDVQETAKALVRSAPRWPKPVDWRSAAARVARPVARPRLVTDPHGEPTTTYVCLRCQDTGWRPACGCDLARMEGWRCPKHSKAPEALPDGLKPLVVNDRNKHQWMPIMPPRFMPLTACECRATNPYWQANRQTRVEESTP